MYRSSPANSNFYPIQPTNPNGKAMEGNRKLMLDRFQTLLNEGYENWCKIHDLDKSDDRLVTFLIDQELIPGTQIQRYAVRREFDKMRKQASFQKTETVNLLAHRFNISERTVWNILKQGGGSAGKK